MTFTKQDFKRLQWSIAAFVLALLLGGGSITGVYLYLQGTEKQNRISNTQRNESKGKLSRAAQEEVELREKTKRFISLKERGLVGTESRLDWIELLSKLSREHKLFDFQFEFSPQKPADANQGLTPSGSADPKFMVSQQRFSAKLLHEGDLLAFIDALRSSARASIVIRGCELSRIADNGARSQLQPQLEIECQLDWITMADSK